MATFLSSSRTVGQKVRTKTDPDNIIPTISNNVWNVELGINLKQLEEIFDYLIFHTKPPLLSYAIPAFENSPQNGDGNVDCQRVSVDADTFQKCYVRSRFPPPKNEPEGSREKPPIAENHRRRQRDFLEGKVVRLAFRVHQTCQKIGEIPADSGGEDESDDGPQRTVQIRIGPDRRLEIIGPGPWNHGTEQTTADVQCVHFEELLVILEGPK